jgi:hypothetical protein
MNRWESYKVWQYLDLDIKKVLQTSRLFFLDLPPDIVHLLIKDSTETCRSGFRALLP